MAGRRSIEEILDEARARLDRVDPADLDQERAAGALIVDIRPVEQRERDGKLPGAVVIDRNVLEWRLDPQSEWRIPEASGYDRRIVVVCNEGFQSSLAAARLQEIGLRRATDLAGGFQAWSGATPEGPEPTTPEAPEPAAEGEKSSIFARIAGSIQTWAALLAVAAVISYAVLRLFYAQFYSRFGVTPEQVGLGKSELLSQSLAGPVIVAVAVTLFSTVLLVFYLPIAALYATQYRDVKAGIQRARNEQGVGRRVSALFAKPEKSDERLAVKWRRYAGDVRHVFVISIKPIMVVSILLGLFAIGKDLSRAGSLADHAREGYAVRPFSVPLGPFQLPVLDVRAEPLTVAWKDAKPPKLLGGVAAQCLMYLGEANDTVVAYDLSSSRSVRFSKDDAVLAVSNKIEFLPGCVPAG